MTFYFLLFFCVFSVICSFLIIVSKNPIHSILYLILAFCNVSFVFIILNIEFVALIFLIVYVGAISVLFLFVVMMLNIKIIELDEVFWRYAPLGFLIALLFLIQFCYLIFNFTIIFNLTSDSTYSIKALVFTPNKWITDFEWTLGPPYILIFIKNNEALISSLFLNQNITQTELLGWYIYTYSFYIFFVLGLVLLIAMIGSIILVLNQNVNVRRQLIFKQVLKNLRSSVVLKN
jgi:NADH-quinone oxidoreductase subunit J